MYYGLQKNDGPNNWSLVGTGFFDTTREIAEAIDFSPAKIKKVADETKPGEPTTFKLPNGEKYRLFRYHGEKKAGC